MSDSAFERTVHDSSSIQRADREMRGPNWWRALAGEKELQVWLAYADRGMYVFPVHSIDANGQCTCYKPDCEHPGKHPRIKDWENAASCDPAVIIEWVNRWPGSNVAWAIGRNGLCALDNDPRNGGDESFARLEKELGLIDTVRQKTGGGGEQHFLRTPSDVPLRCRSNAFGDEYPGVDFKTVGGYVIIPTSRHFSGGVYAWDLGAPESYQELPRAWINALFTQQNGVPGKRKIIPGIDDDSHIDGGARHQVLLTFSGRCAHAGMNAEQILAALVAYSQTRFIPPHSDAEIADELRRIAESAFAKYGKPTAPSMSTAGDGWAGIERTAARIIESPPPPASFDIDFLLPTEDGPAILFGQPGAMKSWVGLHIVMCMPIEAPVFGRFLTKARPESLYVNFDAGRSTFERRVVRMGKALDNVIVLTPDCNDNGEMIALFKRHAGAFIVIDAFADMYHVDRTKDAAEAARDFFQDLRNLYAEHGCNGIIIDHPHRPRPREGSPDGDYYGSIQKLASVRCMWMIAKYGDPKANLAKISCRKMNEAELFPEFVIKADFSNSGFALTYDEGLSSAVAQASVQIADPSDNQRVRAALKGTEGGLSRRQLESLTGLSRERVLATVEGPDFCPLGGKTRDRRYDLKPGL